MKGLKPIGVKGSIRLDQFLKWSGVASTGGHGKLLIQSGNVKVNGEAVVSRGKILYPGDRVHIEGQGAFLVTEGENYRSEPGER